MEPISMWNFSVGDDGIMFLNSFVLNLCGFCGKPVKIEYPQLFTENFEPLHQGQCAQDEFKRNGFIRIYSSEREMNHHRRRFYLATVVKCKNKEVFYGQQDKAVERLD